MNIGSAAIGGCAGDPHLGRTERIGGLHVAAGAPAPGDGAQVHRLADRPDPANSRDWPFTQGHCKAGTVQIFSGLDLAAFAATLTGGPRLLSEIRGPDDVAANPHPAIKPSDHHPVQSLHLMCVQGEPFGFDRPLFPDELVGREAFEGLQSSPEVAGADDVGEMTAKLVVVVAVEAFDRRFPDRAVHPFNLAAIRENSSPGCFLVRMDSGVPDLGAPMFDLMRVADQIKDARTLRSVAHSRARGDHELSGLLFPPHGPSQLSKY